MTMLAQRIHQLIQRFPMGYRRVWAWLMHHEGLTVNKKAVYRVFRLKRWFVTQRKATQGQGPRPAAASRRRSATKTLGDGRNSY
ncbi:MAG: IS3 family transposase [Planctomycetes bacterium]|nr:IS3 family transposase [Planctomycetota bacterium]